MKTELYILRHAVSTQETGPFHPQVSGVYPELKYDDKRSLYRLFDNFNAFSAIDPKIDFLTLKKGARLTDLLSSSMFVLLGFIVSRRFKELFEQFKLPQCKFYKTPVKSGDVLHEYFWIHMLLQYEGKTFDEWQTSNTDFPKSKFYIEKYLNKIGDIEITSYEDLINKQKELDFGKSIKAEKLVMSQSFLVQMPDAFKIPLLSNEWIIKDNFYNAIVKAGITGVDAQLVRHIRFID